LALAKGGREGFYGRNCILSYFDLIRIIQIVGGDMDSYLVRIYRKEDYNPRMLVGVVEEPGVKEKRAFHNVFELWDILNPVKKGQTQLKKDRSSKRSQKAS
jgi:hypothetical protein